MQNNCRCSICNKVSSLDIETDIGDFSKDNFVPDPKNNSHFICTECKGWHEGLMLAYEQEDGHWGWENEEENNFDLDNLADNDNVQTRNFERTD